MSELNLKFIMPYKEKEIEKRYYDIGEVADIMNISTSHIRHYERELGPLHSKRKKRKDRQFTKEDIFRLHRVWTYIEEIGYTFWGVRQLIERKLL